MLRNTPHSTAALRHPSAVSQLPSADYWRQWFGDLADIVGLWVERSRTRRALGFLDDRQLGDLGLSRTDQWHEGSKSFWRA